MPAKAVYRSQISGVCTGLIASRLAPTWDRGRGYISCLAGATVGAWLAREGGVSVADIWRLYRPHRQQARSHRGSRARLHFVPGRGQLWERGLPAKAVYRSQISGVYTGLIASRLAPTGDRGRGYISCLAGVNCGSVACPRRRCIGRRYLASIPASSRAGSLPQGIEGAVTFRAWPGSTVGAWLAREGGVSVADIWRLYRPHREQARSHRGSRARLHFVSGPGQLWERGLPAKAVYRSQISGVRTGLIASRLAPTGDRGRGYISCLAGVNCGSVAPAKAVYWSQISGVCTGLIASRLAPTGDRGRGYISCLAGVNCGSVAPAKAVYWSQISGVCTGLIASRLAPTVDRGRGYISCLAQVNCRSRLAGEGGASVADICRLYRPHRQQARSHREWAACAHFAFGRCIGSSDSALIS